MMGRGAAAKTGNTGFTLIELMITLVVLGIVVTLGVPQFNAFIANQQAKTASQSLYSSLTYARSEAIRENDSAAVEAIGDDWNRGWIVLNANGEELRRVENENGAWRIAVAPSGSSRLEFQRNGRADNRLRFQVCGRGQSTAVTERIVGVDLTGRPSLALGDTCDGET